MGNDLGGHGLPPDSFLNDAKSLGIAFDDGDVERLGAYLNLLLETNKQMNLTAVREPEEAWRRLIFDSLALVPYLTSFESKKVIDVGSGGGIPGLPLAIVMPDVHFTLMDSTAKKARFLECVSSELGLKNVTIINDRAETLGQDHKEHREHYDSALARAVGRLAVVAELTIPFLKVDGHVLAIKGAKAPDEIAEAKQAFHKLHCSVAGVVTTPVNTIVILKKDRKTPRMYPRQCGEPARLPLS